MEEKLLTTKEVSEILGISEDRVSELAERGKIPAYKLDGIYLRFKREQIERLKDRFKDETLNLKISAEGGSAVAGKSDYTFFQRIKDFFYFYDFYILCSLIILLLLILIFRG